MVSADRLFVSQLAKNILVNLLFLGAAATALWGIHVTISLAALPVLWRRGLSDKPRLCLFCILLLILIATTCNLILGWTAIFQMLRYGMIENLDQPTAQRVQVINKQVYNLQAPLDWLSSGGGLLFLIGDMVVVWRAWALWTHRKLFLFIPIVLVFISIVLSVTCWTGITVLHQHLSRPKTSPFTKLGDISAFFSAASNIVTTSMLAYQSYLHWQTIKASDGFRIARTWKILIYLTEIGALYCVLQFVLICLGFIKGNSSFTPSYYTYKVWAQLTLYVSATHPALFVLLVHYSSDVNGGTPMVHTARSTTLVTSQSSTLVQSRAQFTPQPSVLVISRESSGTP